MEHTFDNLKIIYYKKNLTTQQHEFVNDLLNSILKNRKALLEFPPTIDKDYLLCSTLYSLAQQKSKKFVLITGNGEKITEILKIFTKIAKLSNTKQNIKIIPFLDRRQLCKDENALRDITFGNDTTFCYKITASWVPESEKCVLYKVLKEL
jgi:hypothetical protein